MRPLLSIILVVLLGTCPIVCGTSHSSDHAEGQARHHGERVGKSSLPAPANDDDCLCNGALKASHSGLGIDLDGSSSPIDDFLALVLGPHAILPPSLAAVVAPPVSTGPTVEAAGARSPLLRC